MLESGNPSIFTSGVRTQWGLGGDGGMEVHEEEGPWSIRWYNSTYLLHSTFISRSQSTYRMGYLGADTGMGGKQWEFAGMGNKCGCQDMGGGE